MSIAKFIIFFKRLITILLLIVTIPLHAALTTRESVSSAEQQADLGGSNPKISADGRYVVFESIASSLVSNDTNGVSDIFVRDRLTGTTSRVSISSASLQANNESLSPSISADGRYVAFVSSASNLVSGDTNNLRDIFIHDRIAHLTTRVNVDSSGKQSNGDSGFPSVSANGRYVAFASLANNLVDDDTLFFEDIFVRDRLKNKTVRVSLNSSEVQGFNHSFTPAISADGLLVAFTSSADNLVPGDTNAWPDVFVRNMTTGQTSRVSLNSAETQANSISYAPAINANGRFIAFVSDATNLVTGDTNATRDVFLRDTLLGNTTRISINSAGQQGNNVSGGHDSVASISADGRFVAFSSIASNLVVGDLNGFEDFFVRDRATSTTFLATVNSAGQKANFGGSGGTETVSADGRYFAFNSFADNLVVGDNNSAADVFVYDKLLNNSKVSDMQLLVTNKPVSVPKSQVASYLLTIKNNGAANATDVALVDIVTNGVVTNLVPSQGTCFKAALFVCRLGTVAAGASITLDIKIQALLTPLVQKITVHSSSRDNLPGNNSVSVTTVVTP